MRVRDFAALLNRIGNSGRRLAVLVKEPDAVDAAAKLFDFQESLSERNEFMEKIRTSYIDFVNTPLTQKDRKFTAQAPEDLLIEIVTLSGLTVIDNILTSDTQATITSLLRSICVVPPTADTVSHFGFSFVKDERSCIAAQISIVLACGEKLLKSAEADTVCSIAKQVQLLFPVDINYREPDGNDTCFQVYNWEVYLEI